MSATWATPRTAAKHHQCSCGATIARGDRYLEHTCTPGHIGNMRWQRLRECAMCAWRYGRFPLLSERVDS